MTWIRTAEEDDSIEGLREIYDEIIEKRGKIAEIMKVHSLNPQAMKNHLELYMTLMFGKSNLGRAEREMIAVVVSSVNNCEYCLNHHAEALNHFWKDDKRVKQFISDYKTGNLKEKSKAMLHYAVKVTKNPSRITEGDVDSLRVHGFTDSDILNINLIISYFNFVNRIALGLGVTLNQNELKGYLY